MQPHSYMYEACRVHRWPSRAVSVAEKRSACTLHARARVLLRHVSYYTTIYYTGRPSDSSFSFSKEEERRKKTSSQCTQV